MKYIGFFLVISFTILLTSAIVCPSKSHGDENLRMGTKTIVYRDEQKRDYIFRLKTFDGMNCVIYKGTSERGGISCDWASMQGQVTSPQTQGDGLL
jgi:hypothetical protein